VDTAEKPVRVYFGHLLVSGGVTMGFWTAIGISFLFSYLAYLLRPKPKAPPAGQIEESGVPIASASKPIPKVYGTVWIKSPNVVWYGDLKTEPIKRKTSQK